MEKLTLERLQDAARRRMRVLEAIEAAVLAMLSSDRYTRNGKMVVPIEDFERVRAATMRTGAEEK